MGYSDQKYFARPLHLLGQSGSLVGTQTASGTTTVAAAAYRIPTFIRPAKIIDAKVVVKTASTTGSQILQLLNGTNVFATATNTSTNAAGTEVTFTMTNTASTATTTQTTTLANGSVVVGTITTTTDWRIFGTNTGVTVRVIGTATASGDSFGAYDLWVDQHEFPANS